jgi:hypothetical protein
MAALSRSRRSAAGIAFIVGGALILLNLLLGFAQVGGFGSWLVVLADLALGVGFLVLAIGSIANVIARIALIVAAVGWLLLALAAAGVGLPAPLPLLAAIAAALGGVIGSIVLYTGKEITDRSAIAFIVTTIAAAIYLLVPAESIAPLAVLLVLIVGVGFVITGVLFHWVRRGRR